MTLKEEHLRKRFKEKIQEMLRENKGHTVMTFNQDDMIAIMKVFDKLEAHDE